MILYPDNGYGVQSPNCPNGALNKAHAAISLGASNTYCYDPNGSMVRRTISGTTYSLTYNAENKLTAVSGGTTTASFSYDGDGNRVKGTVNEVTTTYIGNYLEWTGSTSTMKRYYYAGAQRVAMREGSTLRCLLGDHLGSTSRIANSDGSPYRMILYKGWGETRYTDGSLPTTYKFTGQRQESSLGGPEGLYYYNARWYDPTLSRFAQADTVGSGDRYAYVHNNPVNYTDPSGHRAVDCDKEGGECEVDPQWQKDKDCSHTFYLNGKVCRLVPVGTFHVTWYYTPDIKDYTGGEMVTVSIPGLGDISIPKELIEGEAGLKMQGIIKIGENQYINWFDLKKTGGKYTAKLTGKPPYIPYYDGAVGPSYFGTLLYIKEFEFTKSGGIFFGADRGEAIVDGDLDIYMGEGEKGIDLGLDYFNSVDMMNSGVFGKSGISNFTAYRVVCDE